jgi:integrase
MARPGVPVFTGQGSALTRAGVWRAVTGLRAVGGLDRHDATHLYRARGADIEIVQEQRGHASIKTTTIYAKVLKEDKARAADALAKAYRGSQRNRQRGASWPRRRPGSPGVPSGSVANP